MDVSVCIANWNCCELLRECLQSLLRQPQGVRLEVIVVDNASTDGAVAMIAHDFPEVKLVCNSTNEGFAKASNKAASHAAGRYLFFLNNDTVVPENSLAKLVAYADAHPEVGMFGPRLRGGDGKFQISYRAHPTTGALFHRSLLFRWTRLFSRSYQKYRRQSYDPNYCGPVDLLMGAAVLIPRHVFLDGCQWDEEFVFGGEDLELSLRIGQRNPIHFVSCVEIVHHGRVSSRQNIGFSTENVALGYLRYLRKRGTPRWAIRAYKAVVVLDIPLQIIAASVQGMLRVLRGETRKAERSFLAARGAWHFLRRSIVKFCRT